MNPLPKFIGKDGGGGLGKICVIGFTAKSVVSGLSTDTLDTTNSSIRGWS